MSSDPDEQNEELERVSEKIHGPVLEFFASLRERRTSHFHLEDLTRFVEARVPDLAPDSPRRVMYDLCKKRQLFYRCTDRQGSLYIVLTEQEWDEYQAKRAPRKPLTPDEIDAALVDLRALVRDAKAAGVMIGDGVKRLGHWLRGRARPAVAEARAQEAKSDGGAGDGAEPR